jgi:hypothetical protein
MFPHPQEGSYGHDPSAVRPTGRAAGGRVAGARHAGGAAATPSVTPRSPWCKPGWYRTGTFLTWKTSPWQSTVRGLNYSRKIRFRFTGGIYARYTYSNCHQSATHFFSSATYYQVKSCIRSWSCSISGWQSYKKRPPAAGYRWPSRYVGWDVYAWIFRVFRL